MRVLGVDEAGRGCVLGPLVVGAFLAVDVDEAALRRAGADDSKKLSHKKRLAAREALGALGVGQVRAITPAEIDLGNLNALEEEAILSLVRELQPDQVFMDALGHPSGLAATAARLSALTPGTSWTIAPKADSTFAVVGAASIFAKTTRDAALAEIDAEYGPVGSGYPSDPITRAWLRRWAERGAPWPPAVRTRWQTVIDLSQGTLLGAGKA